MSVKIDDSGRTVSNWCLGIQLIAWLPKGVYYLTLVTHWGSGSKEGQTQIALIAEDKESKLSAMAIEEPTTIGGLRSFAESCGFQPTDDSGQVFILKKA